MKVFRKILVGVVFAGWLFQPATAQQLEVKGELFTHNSKDPGPDGVSDFNPLKLYTSKSLIDFMRKNGKTLQIYWDDFKLWKNKKPLTE